MRVSSTYMQNSNLASLLNKQSEKNKAFVSLVSNQRITTPSDDPYGAARLVGLDNEMSKHMQYNTTRNEMNNQLKQQESVLNGVDDALQDVRSRVIQALNGTLTDDDRSVLAHNFRGGYETLVSAANTRDGSGNYLFSGYKSDKPPFNIDESTLTISKGSDGKDYQGGDRLNYRVDSGRSISGAATADKVFQSSDGDNMFNIIKNMVNALETPTANGSTTVVDIQKTLSAGLKKIDSSIDNISTVRAEGGTRMNEIDALNTQWGDNKVNLQDDINKLGSVDVESAVDKVNNTKTVYDLCAKAFSMLNKMSLVDLM